MIHTGTAEAGHYYSFIDTERNCNLIQKSRIQKKEEKSNKLINGLNLMIAI